MSDSCHRAVWSLFAEKPTRRTFLSCAGPAQRLSNPAPYRLAEGPFCAFRFTRPGSKQSRTPSNLFVGIEREINTSGKPNRAKVQVNSG